MKASALVPVEGVGLFQWLSGKESACNAGDTGLIPDSGRSPGERNGNPLQYSCQENPIDRGAWRATVHGVTKSQTQLSRHRHKRENTTNHTCDRFILIFGKTNTIM